METIPWAALAMILALADSHQTVHASRALTEAAASPAIRQELARQPWSLQEEGAAAAPDAARRFTLGGFMKEHAWHILTVFLAEEADRLQDRRIAPADEPDSPAPAGGPLDPALTPMTGTIGISHGFLVDHKSPILRGLALGSMMAVNGLQWDRYPDDLMGLIEAHKFNWSTSGLVKNLVRRHRPHSDERDSFYSDAASTAFTWMAYTDSMLARGFQGHPAARAGVAAGLYGAAGYIAWSRVDAGRHYTTDVLAGAAAGFAVGKIFYHMNHRLQDEEDDGPRVQLTPTVTPGGAALSLSIRF